MHRPSILQAVIASAAVWLPPCNPPVSMSSRGGFIEISVHHFRGVSFLLKRAACHFGQSDGAVPPSRTSEGDRQIALALSDIVRDQVRQQALYPPPELCRLRKRMDIARHSRVSSIERTQSRHEMRVRKKAHIENKIGVRGNAVTKPEAHERYQQWPAAGILKAIDNELAQLVHVELSRVDNDIRETADRSHAVALFADSVDDRTAPPERVGTACLAKTALERCIARFNEDQRSGMFGGQPAIYAG